MMSKRTISGRKTLEPPSSAVLDAFLLPTMAANGLARAIDVMLEDWVLVHEACLVRVAESQRRFVEATMLQRPNAR